MDEINNYHRLVTIVILLLFNCSVKAQDLNRQMFSSQGKSIVLKSGTFVSQSIGQQSMFGSFGNESFIMQQGFQHSSKSLYVKAVFFESISTLVYPNPVVDIVNFKFSSEVKGLIKMSILNFAGTQVYRGEKYAMGNILSVESLAYLPTGVYMVYLSGLNYRYAAKLIKK